MSVTYVARGSQEVLTSTSIVVFILLVATLVHTVARLSGMLLIALSTSLHRHVPEVIVIFNRLLSMEDGIASPVMTRNLPIRNKQSVMLVNMSWARGCSVQYVTRISMERKPMFSSDTSKSNTENIFQV